MGSPPLSFGGFHCSVIAFGVVSVASSGPCGADGLSADKTLCSAYRCIDSLVVRASDLRRNGHEFDPWPPHYRSIDTEMGDRLCAGHTTQGNSASYPLWDGNMSTG